MKDHAYICGLAWENRAFYGKDIGVYRLLWVQPTRTRNQDSEVQIIYMIKQVLKSKISKSKIFDRTPICDPFLRLIFEKNPYLEKSKLKAKLQWNLFITTYECYPTLYTAENLNSFGKRIINNLYKKNDD